MKPSTNRAVLTVWSVASVVLCAIQAKAMLDVPPRPEDWVLLVAAGISLVASLALRQFAVSAG